MRGRLIFALLMTFASAVIQLDAFAEDRCGGIYSPGNPYPCCPNGGNCTWWAWAVANDGPPRAGWNDQLPGRPGNNWGDANNWLNEAQNVDRWGKSYGIRFDPAPNTIAVSMTDIFSTLGHLAWVGRVDGDWIEVTDMACYSWYSWLPHRYEIWKFDGFIYPRPKIERMEPQTPRVDPTRDQDVYLWGKNFQATPNLQVYVTYPGGDAYLSGAQIPEMSDGYLHLLVTFGGPGNWSFQIQNEDGGWSDVKRFTVIN